MWNSYEGLPIEGYDDKIDDVLARAGYDSDARGGGGSTGASAGAAVEVPYPGCDSTVFRAMLRALYGGVGLAAGAARALSDAQRLSLVAEADWCALTRLRESASCTFFVSPLDT